jgi:hypothetical protein
VPIRMRRRVWAWPLRRTIHGAARPKAPAPKLPEQQPREGMSVRQHRQVRLRCCEQCKARRSTYSYGRDCARVRATQSWAFVSFRCACSWSSYSRLPALRQSACSETLGRGSERLPRRPTANPLNAVPVTTTMGQTHPARQIHWPCTAGYPPDRLAELGCQGAAGLVGSSGLGG